ncbi:MAG: protein-glutamate O-methyltransferase CheR [Polyangiaceae bacterium]
MIATADLSYICDVVYRTAAIVLDNGKDYLVELRLAPLARAEGYDSIQAMVEHMREPGGVALRAKVVEALTTNETSFFRDQHPFDALRLHVMPQLVRARAESRSIFVWSAACSTGQEAYSIAMLLRDAFPDLKSWNIQIMATDLSGAAVERTAQGRYRQIEVNRGLPVSCLVKYFEREGTEWRIRPELRALIDARQLNLLDAWPTMPMVDVLMLRNVLIYFDVDTKRRILARVRRVLAPDGVMFLGGAETTLNIDDHFDRASFGNAVAYRLKNADARLTPQQIGRSSR